ncbi:hypothetical protein GTQ43_39835 [Nostoc sp. KVJ3]|uniref:hypothetical protein n=1 Tax=Nostoc sp. KVJ3 TaxID=457945 RepID=UPI0022389A04|nr:hypothetical protein [Nostoc sp. KVJ3]MCW5319485.1 hypothetical protein [Nostoc sp. KVJ3]
MEMAKSYAKEIHQNFAKLYANWLPNEAIVLGDFGYLKDGIFNKEGNLKELFRGIEIHEASPNPLAPPAWYKYTSASTQIIEVSPQAQAKVNEFADINARLEIKFSNKNSVFFNAPGCVFKSIDNLPNFKEKIINLYNIGHWKAEYVIVTKLLQATSATIIISASNNSSITLEAEGKTTIDLADVNLTFKAKSENNIGFKLTTESDIIPLVGFHKLKKGFFGLGSLTVDTEYESTIDRVEKEWDLIEVDDVIE